MAQSNSSIPNRGKGNWTSFVYDKQIFGAKCRRMPKKHGPLRAYQLSEIVNCPETLQDVFLGFSLCGNYVYSYREIPVTNDNYGNIGFQGLVAAENRIYWATVWRFIPGSKLKRVFLFKLFDGDIFMDSLYIRLQQRRELPGICVIIGNLSGNDSTTLAKTVWHTALFTAPLMDPRAGCVISFHALHAFSSDICSHDGYLMITTSDELILVNLKDTLDWCRAQLTTDGEPLRYILSMLRLSVGDISKAKQKGSHYFSYTFQTLQWCTEDCEASLHSSCVGLSDYHLRVESLSDDCCEGCVFALYDVDTNERLYYESVFTFRWNLRTNVVERLSTKTHNVTDRSKDPSKQLQAFNELRKELFGKREPLPNYELNNSPVLEGRSLQRIYDSTGLIALTL